MTRAEIIECVRKLNDILDQYDLKLVGPIRIVDGFQPIKVTNHDVYE
jgi:hypothetical protein